MYHFHITIFQAISSIYNTKQQDYHIALDNLAMHHYIQDTICPVWSSSPAPQLQLEMQLHYDIPGDGLLPVKLNNINLIY